MIDNFKIFFWCVFHINEFYKSARIVAAVEQKYRKELRPWAVKKAIEQQVQRIMDLMRGI